MRKYIVILLVIFSTTLKAQIHNSLIGSWKVIDMVDEEEDLTPAQKNYKLIRKENKKLIQLVGEVIYSFEANGQFVHKINGKIDNNGNYKIINNELNLTTFLNNGKASTKIISFQLANNQLTLIIPENSSTLVLFLKKLN